MRCIKALIPGIFIAACLTLNAEAIFMNADTAPSTLPNFRSAGIGSPILAIPHLSETVTLGQKADTTNVLSEQPVEGIAEEIPEETIEEIPEAVFEEAPVEVDEGEALVSFAMEYLGVRYVYGGMSPSGFDCSGFVTYVYNSFGYNIRRTATQLYSFGNDVSKSELQPGDMVFFTEGYGSTSIGHVGIYIGSNQFVHASSGGGRVQVNSLSEHYYNSCYYGARGLLSK